MHSEFRIPDTEERDARQPVVTAATDDEGRFEVAVPTAVPLDVEASAGEHATARRDHLFAGDDVELRLKAAAILEGVLTRPRRHGSEKDRRFDARTRSGRNIGPR